MSTFFSNTKNIHPSDGIYFLSNLDEKQKLELQQFYKCLDLRCVEQLYYFNLNLNNIINFIKKDKDSNNILCYALIKERKILFFKYASIEYGPLFQDIIVLEEAINDIYQYYYKKKYSYITIQLGVYTSIDTELLEYKLNSRYKLNNKFDKYNTKSSIVIKLESDLETIVKNFSKGHKSAIKKAVKDGLIIKVATDYSAFCQYINVERAMLDNRGLAIKQDHNNLWKFIQKSNEGFVLNAYLGDKCVGGGIFLDQGNVLRYYRGASHPDYRNYAISHLVIYHAIKLAKESQYNYLDLWGYNHFAKEGDQIYYINRFKKGFGGSYVFFPRRFNFPLRLASSPIYFISQKILKKVLPILHKYAKQNQDKK